MCISHLTQHHKLLDVVKDGCVTRRGLFNTSDMQSSSKTSSSLLKLKVSALLGNCKSCSHFSVWCTVHYGLLFIFVPEPHCELVNHTLTSIYIMGGGCRGGGGPPPNMVLKKKIIFMSYISYARGKTPLHFAPPPPPRSNPRYVTTFYHCTLYLHQRTCMVRFIGLSLKK